jgi:ribokinase
MKKVISIGALNVDTTIYVDRFCTNDHEEIVKEIATYPGGQAGNVAAGLGKLGHNAFYFGNIGSDIHTLMLMQDFDKLNVDYSYAKRTENPNNSVICIVDVEGSRRLYSYDYVDLTEDDFSTRFLDGADFIVFSSLIKEDAIQIYVDIAERAKPKGIKIALDPGSIFAQLGLVKLKPLLKLCDYIFPSIEEVKILTGGLDNIKPLTDIVDYVIVTCGAEGAKLFQKDSPEKHFLAPEIKKSHIIDSTGAGDCFVAAFIGATLDNLPIDKAILFANHAAALSITKKGARGMPRKSDIEVFMNEK